MPDYDVRDPKITVPPVAANDAENKPADEGYFRYDPFDPRAADAGGFGYGGTNGSAGGFGAGGSGPQTGEYGSQMNYGAGPEYNARDGADEEVLDWVGDEAAGQVAGLRAPNENGQNLPPLTSHWAEGQVAHAPSHPGPVERNDED